MPQPSAALILRMRRAYLALAPLLTLLYALPPRQEPTPVPLPEGVLARVNGQELGVEEYKEYLWRQTGKRLLPQWIDARLIEQACLRYGVEADPAEIEKLVQERLEQLLQGREPAVVEEEMRARGMSTETLRENLRGEFRQNLRLAALVRATRVATDERLRNAFEASFGPGGVRTELRQVLCMPHVMRAELIRAGADPASLDQERMKALARERAESAWARLQGGEDFGLVATELSHDQSSSRSGGMLPAYRPGLYGAPFTEALSMLAIGDISPVIESSAGFHVVQITQRVVSDFHKLRESLVEQVMSAEPTWQEREELLAGLRAQAKIEF